MSGILDAVSGLSPTTMLLNLGGKLIDNLVPDKQAADVMKLKMLEMNQTGALAALASDTDLAKAASAVVEAEAKSEGWLTRSWRPITMLIFVALIVARMFGWTTNTVGEAEYLSLWEMVKIGLGGYVVGRSGLQIAQAIAPAIAAGIAGKK